MNLDILNNLESHLNKASKAQIKSGLSWYKNAAKEARRIAKQTNTDFNIVCGVISAVSPGVRWETNLRDAENLIIDETARLSTYPVHRDKALTILEPWNTPEDIHSILLGKRKRGKKTASFFKNIANYKTDTSVTVDRWMYRAAGLEYNIKYYDQIADAIALLAVTRGLLPHQVQAIIWETIRG